MTRISLRINKNRRINLCKNDLVKLNLGAGLSVRQGWINVDASLNALISTWPKFIQKFLYNASGSKHNFSFEQYYNILKNNRFIYHNLIFGIPLIDNCVDYIYCSHLLEHLTHHQGVNLIKEMYRALKKNGIIRLVVPDLAYVIDLYCSGEKEAALKKLYNHQESKDNFARHKFMYDFDILRDLLTESGFTDITQCEYQQGETPDIEFLDNRPQDSLYVEATRK